MTPDTANISVREYDEALYVENGSIVPRSGTVKTTRQGELLGVKLIGDRDTENLTLGFQNFHNFLFRYTVLDFF